MLRFISKLNEDLKDQLFILCSATSRYLATIKAQLMLRNVVPNSFVTPEGRMSSVSFIFLNFLGKNLTIGAPIKIYWRRRRFEFIGGGGVPAAAPGTLSRYHGNSPQEPSADIPLATPPHQPVLLQHHPSSLLNDVRSCNPHQ